jgi:hypothetical protein
MEEAVQEKSMLSARELISLLDNTVMSLHQWRQVEGFPEHVEEPVPGRRRHVYFNRDEVLAWINANRPRTWKRLLAKGIVTETATEKAL